MYYARLLMVVLGTLSLAFTFGCGASQSKGSRPPAAAAEKPDGVMSGAADAAEPALDFEQATQAFQRAEQRMGRLLAQGEAGSKRKRQDRASTDLADAASPAADDARAAVPPTPAPVAREEAEPGTALAMNMCQLLCRALASMDHSAERLCALAGSDDDRCLEARERVARAREQVQARCPECVVQPPKDE